MFHPSVVYYDKFKFEVLGANVRACQYRQELWEFYGAPCDQFSL